MPKPKAPRWQVEGDWFRPFGTYERALRRARKLAKLTGYDKVVLELDRDGNPTPVAHVKARLKIQVKVIENGN